MELCATHEYLYMHRSLSLCSSSPPSRRYGLVLLRNSNSIFLLTSSLAKFFLFSLRALAMHVIIKHHNSNRWTNYWHIRRERFKSFSHTLGVGVQFEWSKILWNFKETWRWQRWKMKTFLLSSAQKVGQKHVDKHSKGLKQQVLWENTDEDNAKTKMLHCC